jgi:hypothetical protein
VGEVDVEEEPPLALYYVYLYGLTLCRRNQSPVREEEEEEEPPLSMHAIDTDSRSTFNLLLKSYSILLNQQF